MCVQRKYDASMSYRANMSILCQDRKKRLTIPFIIFFNTNLNFI